MRQPLPGPLQRELIINLITNAVLNAAAAWLLYRAASRVATDFWSVFIDTCITCQCVCVITTLFESAAGRRYAAAGLTLRGGRWLRALPEVPIILGITLAGAAAPTLIVILGGGLTLLGVEALPVWGYTLYKAVWGGLLGLFAADVALRRSLLAREEAEL